jgi:hypothetical protein
MGERPQGGTVFENSILPEGRASGVASVILRTVIGLNFAYYVL